MLFPSTVGVPTHKGYSFIYRGNLNVSMTVGAPIDASELSDVSRERGHKMSTKTKLKGRRSTAKIPICSNCGRNSVIRISQERWDSNKCTWVTHGQPNYDCVLCEEMHLSSLDRTSVIIDEYTQKQDNLFMQGDTNIPGKLKLSKGVQNFLTHIGEGSNGIRQACESAYHIKNERTGRSIDRSGHFFYNSVFFFWTLELKNESFNKYTRDKASLVATRRLLTIVLKEEC